jgi:hypothetical protein
MLAREREAAGGRRTAGRRSGISKFGRWSKSRGVAWEDDERLMRATMCLIQQGGCCCRLSGLLRAVRSKLCRKTAGALKITTRRWMQWMTMFLVNKAASSRVFLFGQGMAGQTWLRVVTESIGQETDNLSIVGHVVHASAHRSPPMARRKLLAGVAAPISRASWPTRALVPLK